MAGHRGKLSRILSVPLEPVLQSSPTRLKALGIFILVFQPLCGIAWSLSIPQPYESIWLRVIFGLFGLSLIWPRVCNNADSPFSQRVASVVFWLELPFFFCWMYVCNGGNTEWAMSVCCMILIYYHLVDWRIASVGLLLGALSAGLLNWGLSSVLPVVQPIPLEAHGMLFGFCWFSAITLGASSANLRHVHVSNTLQSMCVIGQELKAPLMITAKIADSLQQASLSGRKSNGPESFIVSVDHMASQLHALVRSMNHTVDTQMLNASYLRLPTMHEDITAFELLNEAIGKYPFASAKERGVVSLAIPKDFVFSGSFNHFIQVITNLLENSLHALQQTKRKLHPGDILIQADVDDKWGTIRIQDCGRGIPGHLLNRVFEPFFTTDRARGMGLGLTYCQTVIELAGGTLHLESRLEQGTVVTLRVPRRLPLRAATLLQPSRSEMASA